MEPARAIRPIPKPSLNRSWAARLAERPAGGVGLVCMVTCGALCIDAAVSARYELGRFARLQAAALEQPPAPDLSLWDLERIAALNRAVGHIDGTALPETEGNSGIAGCSVREWEARAHSRATGAPP